MKNILMVLYLTFCLNYFNIKGQEDTMINQNSLEINKKTEDVLIHKHEYLEMNLMQEKNLFKIDIAPYMQSSKSYGAYSLLYYTLAFEHKLNPSFSILLSNNSDFLFDFDSHHYAYSFRGNMDIRYYYLIKKRMRESIGANNFHSNYFAVGFNGLYFYVKGSGGPYKSDHYEMWYYLNPAIQVSWGMQRRIGKWAFYDIGPYFMFHSQGGPYIGANLHLGLAWGW